MATSTVQRTDTSFALVEPVGADGVCTVHERAAGTSYRIVDYADRLLCEKLAARSVGETIRLDLVPADPDGLDWIVTRVRPGAPATDGAS